MAVGYFLGKRTLVFVLLSMYLLTLYFIHGYYSMLTYNRHRREPFERVLQDKEDMTSFSCSKLVAHLKKQSLMHTDAVLLHRLAKCKINIRNVNPTDGIHRTHLDKNRKRNIDNIRDSFSRKHLHRESKTDNEKNMVNNRNKFTRKQLQHTNCICNKKTDKAPLLVLFSTWSDNMSGRIRDNTCYNWRSLRPLVQPVLFTNSSSARRECEKNGWSVLPLRQTAAGGAPVLKVMFAEVLRRFNSTIYGFSNGDILFGENLLKTLVAVEETFGAEKRPLLLIGTRTNVVNVTSPEASSFSNLQVASKKRGKLFIHQSQDYFITNKAFPWSDIPGVVVGRRGYDNWIVINSILKQHTVIDATETILAVHQTTRKGIYEGHSRPYPDYNTKLLARYHKTIRYVAGSTRCAGIITKYSVKGNIFALKRNSVPKFCKNPYP
ncbi:uncharacterized protein LOC121367948 [Gigantopelta aegis]|uniref:uncharacterized protein LOC121367948 n=1 Tax=Gigantopelta aegis TaxID=1735272 RepID=UPI001B88AEE8|nr:uncharacterized protein LOC121367948 [Gigantopelta aegis]